MARQRLTRYPPSDTESQWFFTRQELDHSPSVQQGMDWKEERRNRQRMIHILWQLRNISKLSQVVINTAATLLQRFYMRVSFQQWDKYHAVAAAFFLAAKVEEKPINSKNVTSMLRFLMDPMNTKNGTRIADPRHYRLHESEYSLPDFIKRRKEILHYEETMLRMECFDMNLRHPHALLGRLVDKVWKGKGTMKNENARLSSIGSKVLDVGWCIANDTLAAPTCLLYRPHLITACCLALACIVLRQPLPEKPPLVEEQRALWDQEREEGEEETEESAFQEEIYWLELLEVRSDELREPIMFILENWKLAQDSFISEEAARIRPKIMKALNELSPWPVDALTSGEYSGQVTKEGDAVPAVTNTNGGTQTEPRGGNVQMEEMRP